MDLAAIFFLLIVLFLIALFVTWPFFSRQRTRAPEKSRELSPLLAERERLLAALQELEFDKSLGKIPAEDYPTQRSELLHKGAEVLRQLDALSSGTLKQAIGKGRRSSSTPSANAPLSDDDLEDLLAKRRNARKDKTAGFCPKCGKPVSQSDVFCSSCGNTIK